MEVGDGPAAAQSRFQTLTGLSWQRIASPDAHTQWPGIGFAITEEGAFETMFR